MQLDHIIYAAPDLEEAAEDVEALLGVRASGGGKHSGLGTHNRLLSLGPRTYLEIVAPDPDQPEPAAPRPYGVDGVTHPAIVGWAVAPKDIDTALASARARGFDPGDVIDGHRVTPAGDLLRWRITTNALKAGPVPFLISWGETPHPALSAPSGLELDSFHLEHPDVARIQSELAALGVDVAVRQADAVAMVLRVRGPRGVSELR